MQFLVDLISSIGDLGQTVVDFFNFIPTYFQQFIAYLNAWYIHKKLEWLIWSMQIYYLTAKILLEEIGFTQAIASAFNALPDELRYYAHAFGLPRAISVYFNFVATGFVMKMLR
ncbi:DUF2523 domain-containing protein [Vibrio fluvialis]|uniref:DUF2523 family protein n=1 Tax=Vibrio TaxID=662 RepID=UPI001C9C175B|nr:MULTISPECIES: DUF2523 family protein [Vibrio]EKO3371736.1 DUF2523 domain-containing protein [Vibrio fluvialis]EKO3539428.1 DUF2523 domain-containing protein [Vibrio fluvialis]MBY7934268.1 DUF2523 domain-containing protein [Vibrio fluvialis]MBY8058625.1 DUF2523 domain-containing protein [Vibrio fluvialis]MBY8197361.1 DUF2523 domain-containing protein [Vibrio fluvialis]